MLGLAAIPLALVLFMFPLVPESPRCYMVKGKTEKAQKVISKIAWMNCKKVPTRLLVPQEEKDSTIIEEDAVLYSNETVTFLSSSYDISRQEQKKDENHNRERYQDNDMIASPQDVTCNGSHVTSPVNQDLDDVAKGEDSESDETPLLSTETGIAPSLSFKRTVVSKVSVLFQNGMWRTMAPLSCSFCGLVLPGSTLGLSSLQHPYCSTTLTVAVAWTTATPLIRLVKIPNWTLETMSRSCGLQLQSSLDCSSP